jgi:hypothetical protein
MVNWCIGVVHVLFVGARRVKIVEVFPCCMMELNVEYTRHTSVTICTVKHLICSVIDTSVHAVNILISEHDARPNSY